MSKKEQHSEYTQEVVDVKLSSACFEGNLEEVKFLLTSPQLKLHANIHYNDNEPVQYAISNGHINVIDYLLNSKELKENADIHACEDVGFKYAIFKKRLDVLQYLIFDFNIDKNQVIEGLLENPLSGSIPLDENTVEHVKKMFEMRDLKANLQGDLTANHINKQKAKI